MSFTELAKAELAKPLDKSNVASRTQSGRSMSYVEGWHVIAEANRIFGFDGWTRETLEMREVRSPELVKNSNGKETWRVGFVCRVRVTVGGVVREGTGFGSGALPDLGEAYESAVKEAETDAMKRALITFGNPFGLALYDKTQANVSDGKEEEQAAASSQLPRPTSSLAFDSHAASIRGAATLEALQAAFNATKADKTLNKAECIELVALKDARKAVLLPPAKNLGEHLDRLQAEETVQ